MKTFNLYLLGCTLIGVCSAEARSDRSWRLSDGQNDVSPLFGRSLADDVPPQNRDTYHHSQHRGPHPSSTVSIPPRTDVFEPSHEREEAVTSVFPKFRGARWIALANVLLFALRPDPDVYWPARVPRVLWELILFLNLQSAPGAKSTSSTSIYYLWLTFLTGTTGLVDLFVWAPLYGAFVNFQTCEGGWLQPKVCHMDPIKGYSRLLVAVQSVVGGMVYLHAAITAWHTLHVNRRERDRQQQQEDWQAQLERQQQREAVSMGPPYRYAPLPFDPSQRPYPRR